MDPNPSQPFLQPYRNCMRIEKNNNLSLATFGDIIKDQKYYFVYDWFSSSRITDVTIKSYLRRGECLGNKLRIGHGNIRHGLS
jgi:hypothetical protein